MKVYKQKIKYHNANADYDKGTLWFKKNNAKSYYPENLLTGHDLPLDFVEKNLDIFENGNKDYMIQLAKKKYPIGTKFYCAVKKDIKYTTTDYTYNKEFNGVYSQNGWLIIEDKKPGSIKEAEIIKESLAVTEDDVDLFEGDVFYSSSKESKAIKCNTSNMNKKAAYENGWRWFSTEKLANDYYNLNVEKYSINFFLKNAIIQKDENGYKFQIEVPNE